MARGRRGSSGPSKAEVRRQRAAGLTPSQFFDFIAEVGALKSELEEATTQHASGWKKADGLGVHNQAAKLFLRLNKMDATKRKDFLRSFDNYRAWANDQWNAEPDMFEQPTAGEGAGAQQQAGGSNDDDDGGQPLPLDGNLQGATAGDSLDDTVAKLESDWGADGNGLDDATLDTAGLTFGEGKLAGLDGADADDNPHSPDVAAHGIWEKGRLHGAAEKAASGGNDSGGDDRAEPAPTPEPVARGRRRAAAPAEARIH